MRGYQNRIEDAVIGLVTHKRKSVKFKDEETFTERYKRVEKQWNIEFIDSKLFRQFCKEFNFSKPGEVLKDNLALKLFVNYIFLKAKKGKL